MDFQDKRVWYAIAGVVIVIVLFWVFWPAGEAPPPAPATSPPATTTQ